MCEAVFGPRRLFLNALLCVTAMMVLPAWGVFVPIEGTADARWRNLAQQFREGQGGKGNRALNVLQLGDSHTAGEYWSERLRTRFRESFGAGGIGLLPPGVVKDHPVYEVRVLPSPQWVTVREKASAKKDSETLGLGGYVGYGSAPYQTVIYKFSKSTDIARLYVYSKGPAGTADRGFKLFVDGAEVIPRPGKAAASTVGHTVFDLPKPGSRLTLLVKGGEDAFKLFGISGPGRDHGVTFSSIGVIGATLDVLRSWDSDITRQQIKDYAPALLILAFGTNDVVSPDFTEEKFSETLQQTASWIRRNAPDAAVLFIMPPSAPGFNIRSMQNAQTARILIRHASRQYHWRVWDWSVLTEKNCVTSCATPDAVPFFRGDGIHLTKAGYETTADALFDALITSDRHF